MGSIGKGTTGTNSSTTVTDNPTKRNKYGFDIEATDYPEVEFTDRHWAKMEKLKEKGMFEDSDLRNAVDDKISDLVDKYDDLARYDEDLTNLRDRIENNGVTEDEYWAGYHAMADMLGIKQKRRRRK